MLVETAWARDLEGYVAADSIEIDGEFGLKIFVKIDRQMGQEDKRVLSRARAG